MKTNLKNVTLGLTIALAESCRQKKAKKAMPKYPDGFKKPPEYS